MSFKMYNFNEVITDITGGNRKFKGSEYLEKGLFPIIDQGEKFIAGFTNEKYSLKLDKPVIIFGDHTRVLKYVDFDFCLGADGIKVLKTDKNLLPKFTYYYLKSIDIPNLGYSRHFKFLKKLEIPLPPLSIQKEIAEKLDRADALRKKDQELLKQYDELAQSVFIEMFGDPVKNEKSWEVQTLKNVCSKIGSGSTPRGGKESYLKEGISLVRSLNIHDRDFRYKDLAFLDSDQAHDLRNVSLQKYDVLFNITGASVCRCCIVPENILPGRVNQHVSILRCIEKKVNPIFLNSQLIFQSKKEILLDLSKSGGATREAITKVQLEAIEIILPPIEVQKKFAIIIENIEHQKKLLKQQAAESENLFQSLLQESFK